MIVSCDQCGQGYEVKPEQVRKSLQRVRCSSCLHSWDHDFSLLMKSKKKHIPKKKHKGKFLKYFLGIIILCGVLGSGFWYFQDKIISHLSAISFSEVWDYFRFGIRSQSKYLLVEDLRIQKQKVTSASNKEIILVSGRVQNISDSPISAPALKVSIYGSCDNLPTSVKMVNFFKPYAKNAGQCLHQRWNQPLKAAQLNPHDTASFSFHIQNLQIPDGSLVIHP